jgi:hypothetical protein
MVGVILGVTLMVGVILGVIVIVGVTVGVGVVTTSQYTISNLSQPDVDIILIPTAGAVSN